MFRKHFKDRLIDAKVGYTGGNVDVSLLSSSVLFLRDCAASTDSDC